MSDIETLGAMGQAHGECYVALSNCRIALDSALEEMTKLQESCGKFKEENTRLRSEIEGLRKAGADMREAAAVAARSFIMPPGGNFVQGNNVACRSIEQAILAIPLLSTPNGPG
jgi:hypothetical protein